MRRILVVLVILAVGIAGLAALWIFRGREIPAFIDRYRTVGTQSTPIQSIAYEASGTGGTLICDDVSFSLNDVRPGLSVSVGSTKDNQLAVASSGKVFAFGPLKSTSKDTAERLVTALPPGDHALVTTRHSVLAWPTPFDINLNDRSIAVLETPHLLRNCVEEIRRRQSADALALRAIFLSRKGLGRRIYNAARLHGSDSSRNQGVTG
jgi:hypothetical protein